VQTSQSRSKGIVRNWDRMDIAPEMDKLGERLDLARDQLARSVEGSWSHQYWTEAVAKLEEKWRRCVNPNSTEMPGVRAMDIDRGWIEEGEDLGWMLAWFNKVWYHWTGPKLGSPKELDKGESV